MSKIGSGFAKENEKGKFITMAIDEELLPITITKDHLLTAFYVPREERKSEKSPAYALLLSLKKDRTEAGNTSDEPGE